MKLLNPQKGNWINLKYIQECKIKEVAGFDYVDAIYYVSMVEVNV